MFDAPIYICVQNMAFRIVIGIGRPFQAVHMTDRLVRTGWKACPTENGQRSPGAQNLSRHDVGKSSCPIEAAAKTLKIHHKVTKLPFYLLMLRVSASLWSDFYLFAVDSPIVFGIS
jgi:hypothetical protein